LNGSTWPVDGKILVVDFVNESEITCAIEKNQSPYASMLEKEKEKAALRGQLKPNDTNTASNTNIQTNLNLTPNTSNITLQKGNISEESAKTLDNLFRKTETKPHIYFLPLTEEEVQEKRNKLKLNK
jgi:apoptotic chromatin condensation inducer in the nucleus